MGEERFVLITTAHRGVFAGWVQASDGDSIRVRAGRNCIHWTRDVGGFLGLAERGPTGGCRIGAPADIELRAITSVAECTDQARQAWESAPVYRG